MAERRNTAQALVEGLIANGIETLYALPGVQNDPFFDALFHAQNRLRVVHTRHEQGAAYMALGAAMATGRPQALCVVPGPGLLNASAALATAYSNNAPVLALVGQIPLHAIGRGTGQLHEIIGQTEVLATLCKWRGMVRGPTEAGPLLDEAFRQMLSGRPRPVALEVPMDVWTRAAAVPLPQAIAAPAPPLLDTAEIARAAALLAKAERPMLVVGGGAQGAGPAVTALAEALGAPVLAFRMGRGVVDARHPLDIRLPVGHALWRETDVVCVIGSRAQQPLGGWGQGGGPNVIRIDADPEEATRFGVPDVLLTGDAAAIVPALRAALPAGVAPRPAWTAHVATTKQAVMARVGQKLAPQIAWLEAMRAALPEDGILFDELTQVGYVSRLVWPTYRPRTFLSTGLQGTLGWGFASALGAKRACPDRAVLSICGDGGFMFNVQELATAVQHGIATVTVVFNDGAFGNVKGFQKTNFGGRTIASDLRNPDFVRLGESFGAQALRAETPAALGEALRRGFATTDTPTLIEVPVGEFPSPWEFIMLPKVR